MTLQWQAPRTDEPGYKSACNRYMLCESEGRWQVWKLAPGAAWFALLANHVETEFGAREVADDDVRGRGA